ncbi:unnamed protein product [Orchesella dallaii]|uniref:Ionotropic glutamate receptor C-terminal domain-containing protein n=1 Tax=Orchesella dallaii TaxID=48710 RepID=A0ABP1QSM1_9HEXA
MFHKDSHILFKIFFLYLHLQTSSSFSTSSEPVSEVLHQVIRDSFQFCDISIDESIWKNLQFSNNCLPIEDRIKFAVLSLLQSLNSINGAYFHTSTSNISATHSKSHAKLVRRHQPCITKLYILFLSQNEENNPAIPVSPNANPPVISKSLQYSLRSQDYFFFISSHLKSTSEILLSNQVGLKMKNKIALLVHHAKPLQFYTSCSYCNNGKPKLIKLHEAETDWEKATLFPDYMTDFNGVLIRMCAPKIAPRFTLTPQPDGSYKLTRGLYKYMVEDALQVRYNFTYEITKSHEYAVGNLDSNLQWNGIMKDVLENRVDVGLCVGMTFHRFSYIEFGSIIEAEYLTFSSGNRPPFLSWKAIFWAFRKDMWIATSVAFFLASLVMYLLVKCGRTEEKVINSFESVCRYLYITFVDQSIDDPRSWHLRVFCGAWLFYSLVVSNAFREKLFGFLGFPLQARLPQSFQELADSNFDIGLQFYGGAAYNHIKSSKTGALNKIGGRMTLETDPIRCFTKALDKKFTCIHYHGAAEFVRARNLSDRHGKSNIVVAPASTLLLPISFIMQKDHLLMEKFNSVVKSVRDMGLVSEWKRMDFNLLLQKRVRWEMANGIFKKTTDLMSFGHVRALRLNQLLGLFGILSVGSIVGLLCFIIEQGSKFEWVWVFIQEMCKPLALVRRFSIVSLFTFLLFRHSKSSSEYPTKNELLQNIFTKIFPFCDIKLIIDEAQENVIPQHNGDLDVDGEQAFVGVGEVFQRNPTKIISFWSHSINQAHLDLDPITAAKLKIKPKLQLEDFRKHNEPCTAVLIGLTSGKTWNSSYNIILDKSLELTKRNKDIYMIFSPSLEVTDGILLSTKFGIRTRFRVVFTAPPFPNVIKNAHTLCLHCNNGEKQLIPLDLDSILQNNPKFSDIFPDHHNSFGGAVLRTCAPNVQPRFSLSLHPNGTYSLARGLYKFLVEDALRSKFNFTFQIRKSYQSAVGLLNKTSYTWNGVMKDVLEKEIDMGLNVGNTYDKYPFVEFSQVFEMEYLTFSCGNIPPTLSWKAIVWPFQTFMWVATIMAVLTAQLVLNFLLTWSKKLTNQTDKYFQSPVNTFRFVLSTIIEQSGNGPEINSIRVFCSTWLLFSLVVTAAFREKLFGFLSFPINQVYPKTFEQLADSKYEIGLQFYGGSAYNHFKSSTSSSFIKLVERMSLVNDSSSCFTQAMSEKRYSCIHYYGAYEFVKARNLSDRFGRTNIVVSPTSTLLLSISVIMEKGNVWMDKFNRVLIRFRDFGLVSEWKRMDFNQILRKRIKWEYQVGISSLKKEESYVKAITIQQLYAPFGLLIIGCGVALIRFIFEKLKVKDNNVFIASK